MNREATLLRQIQRSLPPTERQRYEELTERSYAETLSVAERRELQLLEDRMEEDQVERTAACNELARLRGVPVGKLREELGLGPSPSSSSEAAGRGAGGSDGFRHLGITLRVLRKMKGMSQAEWARRARCGKSQLSKYEAGEAPSLATLDRLLAALDVTPLGLGFAMASIDSLAVTNLPRQAADLARCTPATLQVFGQKDEAGLALVFAELTANYLNLMRSLHSLYEGRIEAELRRSAANSLDPSDPVE